MPQILIVDDHPPFRNGFAYMIGIKRPGWALRLVADAEAITSALEAVSEDHTSFGDGNAAKFLPKLTAHQTEKLSHPATGCSNTEIRHRLSNAERTIRAHLANLFEILSVQFRIGAVVCARDLGLIS